MTNIEMTFIRSKMRFQYILRFFFLFRRARIYCEPKGSSRGVSFAQNSMSQTKVTVPKHLKFRSSLFKGLWESKGPSPWSPPQRRNPPAHSNKASKTIKRKAKVKSLKAQCSQKSWYNRCNVSYNLK